MDLSDQSEETLFQKCLTIPPSEREGYLKSICGSDIERIKSILSLLEAHDSENGFLDSIGSEETFLWSFDSSRISPSDECVGDQIGRYRLVRLIGEGAWGTVWLADQIDDIHRQVALKILKLGLDTKDFLTRFNSERQILAMMSHPHIATIYDAGSTEYGRPYLVMEYVDGMALLDYATRNRLGIQARVELGIQVCEALLHAHQKGVIHRDIKPSNVLVAEQDGHAVAKVIDFGIAKTTRYRLPDNSLLTNVHTFIGTPIYCSPEQLDGRNLEIDVRSDIYSLGAILYELLCGQTPFNVKEVSELGIEAFRTLVKETVPVRPSVRFAKLSGEKQEEIAANFELSGTKLQVALKEDLDWIIMKCLEKAPSDRYDSCQSLGDDLKAHLAGKPVSVGGPSLLYRGRKYLARKRTSYSLILELSLVLTVILALVLFFKDDSRSSVATMQDRGWVESLERSIAVLPLENLSAESSDAYLSQSVQEAILSNLSRMNELSVFSRASTEPYDTADVSLDQIASELGVRYLVKGSVEKREGSIQIDLGLVDSQSNKQVWTHTYETVTSDLLAIQSRIAKDLAAQLDVHLSPSETLLIDRRPTVNHEAYENYQIARFLTENTYPGGPKIAQYEKVVALDPQFAEAWAQLAVECIWWWTASKNRNDPILQAKAHQALAEAKRWGAELPDIPYAESNFAFYEDQNLQASIQLLLKSLAIDDGFRQARSHLAKQYFGLGELDKAVHVVDAAFRLDPRSAEIARELYHLYQVQREFEKAEALCHTQLAVNSSDVDWRLRLAQNKYLEGGDISNFAADIRTIPDFVETPRGQVWLSLHARDLSSGLKYLEDLENVHGWDAFNFIFGSDRGFNLSPVAVLSALVAFELGEHDVAVNTSRRVRAMMDGLLRLDPQFDPRFWANLVICYAIEGDLENMESIITTIREATGRDFWRYKRQLSSELRIAMAYLVIGDDDLALMTLENASQMPSPLFLKRELELWFIFDRLRGNPRFEALLRD